MTTSAIVVDKARQLTAAGQHAEVVNYLAARQGSELVESASLALLYGTAQARLGRHAEGLRWLDTALEQARKGGERGVESRALNARGAMSLVSGRLDEAADYCTRRSEEHTSELQSQSNLVCRLLLEKKKNNKHTCSTS